MRGTEPTNGKCGKATQNAGDIADNGRLSLCSIFYANRCCEVDKETASGDRTGNGIELTTLARYRAMRNENDGYGRD